MSHASNWWARIDKGLRLPVGRVVSLACALLFSLLPIALFWDELSNARLKGDDFVFLADSRAGHEPLRLLLTPHNAHVVPLFRLLTAALARLAGSLGEVAGWLTWGNYAAFAALSLATGHFIAWETRRYGAGLGAMACFSLSTVIYPAAIWYSAGQTLWAALCAMGCLVMLQQARRGDSFSWWVGALAAAFAAPLFWTGGIAAGLAGSGYAFASRLTRARWRACLPTLASVVAVLAMSPFGWSAWTQSPDGPRVALWERGSRAITHSCQAIVESLLFKNLGQDAASSPGQAVAIVIGLALIWIWTRRGRVRLNALEAPGLVLVFVPYVMAFALRAGFAYSNLRALGWYDTIPQAGFVLFVAGWLCNGHVREPGLPVTPNAGGLFAVIVLALALFGIQSARVSQLIIASAPPMTDELRLQLPIPELQRLRAVVVISDLAARQRRALQRLEQAQRVAVRTGASRSAIHAAFGRVLVPNWPEKVRDRDALDLITIAETGGRLSPAGRAAFAPLFAQEPVPDFETENGVFGRQRRQMRGAGSVGD